MTVRPIELPDLIAYWRADPPSWVDYHAMRLEVLRGRVFGAFVDGAPIALGGIKPIDGRPVVWFSVRSGGLGRQARRAISGMRVILYPGVVCFVRHDNSKGQKLARMLGFKPVYRNGNFDMWER